ncbi:MAG: 1-acyl-sn-glycerol-3-phosphate acyltransferase [Ignavibacteriales bacterium]|nr:MAG: 1-acyl-sn-glycerol-3-phosphate acyltransferase [Ignavibacteriales bacterium]
MTYIKLFLILIHTIICSVLSILFSVFDRSLKLFFWLSRFWPGGIFLFSGIKVKATGLENFDHSGTYVFVSNHSSQFDIPAIQYTAPVRVCIIYKKELEKIPLFGWQLAVSPYIAINRTNPEDAFKSIEKAKVLMKKRNISVILFAEGTRSKTGEIQPFKRVAFYLASKTGFPIIPVTINGTAKLLPKGTLKIKSGTIHVHFDKPIFPKENLNKKEELELMNEVRNKVISNFHEE